MKVAIVETGGWGGIAHYAWNLSEALAQEGAGVRLLTNTVYELENLRCSFDVTKCVSGKSKYPKNAVSLWRALNTWQPEVIHVQSLLSSNLDLFLWPLIARCPLVFTAHNIQGHEGRTHADWTLERCYRSADAVVAHTHASQQHLADLLGPRARVELIRQGDYAFFGGPGAVSRGEARRRLGLPEGGRVLLMFGAIRPYKGILDVISVLPVIRAAHPDVMLVVAGPLLAGSQAEYLRAIRQARVEPAVVFRPAYVPHDRVSDYFHAADAAVFNYQDITDSAALRIACSLGVPVVATAVGGFREFLSDRVTGRLVAPRDREALATAVIDLLSNPAEAKRLADAARALAGQVWSWRDSARATLQLYRSLCSTGPSEAIEAKRA